MKSFKILILLLTMTLLNLTLMACSKEVTEEAHINKTNTVSLNEETEVTETESEEEAVEEEVTFDENNFDSYFEDPIFAQALRHHIEDRIGMSIEEYGIKELFDGKKSTSVGINELNRRTEEVLDRNFREQITSIKGIENFKYVSDVQLGGLINVPGEQIENFFLNIDYLVLKAFDLSNCQINDLSFIDPDSEDVDLDNVREIHLNNTGIDDDDLAIFEGIGCQPNSIDVSYTNVTKLPELDYSYLSYVYISGLDSFDTESLIQINNFSSSKKNDTLPSINLVALGTYLDFTSISQLSLRYLDIGHEDYTVSDLAKFSQEDEFAFKELFFYLGDYTGFGDLLLSGQMPTDDYVILDLKVTEDLLNEWKGYEEGDNKASFVTLINPIYDEDIPRNLTDGGMHAIRLLHHKNTLDRLSLMPRNVESYFRKNATYNSFFSSTYDSVLKGTHHITGYHHQLENVKIYEKEILTEFFGRDYILRY